MLYDNFIVSKPKVTNKIVKTDFSVNNIELYVDTRKFMINLNVVNEEKLLMVLSSVNEAYNVSKKIDKKSTAFVEKIIKELPTATSIIRDKKKSYPHYYLIIKTSDLLKDENILYESSLIFRFFHLMGLKSNLSDTEVFAEIEKFSFYSIYDAGRWPKIADWELFFDSEHLSGNFQEVIGI